MKKIDNATIKFLSPVFGVIDKKPKLSSFDLPFKVTVSDLCTDETRECELINVFPFDGGIIPDILSYQAEFESSEIMTPILLERLGVKTVEELCYYQYRTI